MTRCGVCGQSAGWVASPVGGWFAHVAHPEDGHDALIPLHWDELESFLNFVEGWLHGAGFEEASEHLAEWRPEIADEYLESCCQPADLINVDDVGSWRQHARGPGGPGVRQGGATDGLQPLDLPAVRGASSSSEPGEGLRSTVPGVRSAPPQELSTD